MVNGRFHSSPSAAACTSASPSDASSGRSWTRGPASDSMCVRQGLTRHKDQPRTSPGQGCSAGASVRSWVLSQACRLSILDFGAAMTRLVSECKFLEGCRSAGLVSGTATVALRPTRNATTVLIQPLEQDHPLPRLHLLSRSWVCQPSRTHFAKQLHGRASNQPNVSRKSTQSVLGS